VRLKYHTLRLARSKQGSKIHSALEQRRSQLQKKAAALRECLVDYEFRALQCCTPFCQIEATGEENSLSPGTAQLTTAKAVFANVSKYESIRVGYVHMAHTFGLEST